MKQASPTVENFLSKLNGVRETGSGWQARCPCRNDDENPSLSIGQGNDGRVLVNCHRGDGCPVDTICQSVGMKVTDLYPPNNKAKEEKRKLSLVANYDYRDLEGKLVFQKQRFVDQFGKKTFKQRRPDPRNGEWVYTLEGVEKILYRLPQVAIAKANNEVVWLVEGEKDADTVASLGMCGTTMPGGAGKWLDIHTDALAGATVFIVADNDEVGREHAKNVKTKLEQAGCTVSLFIPPQGFKDVTEMVEKGQTLNDLADFSDIPVNDLPSEVVEEENEDTAVVEATAMENLLGEITKVLTHDKLSESSKLNRASMLLNAFGGSEDEHRGRLVNWSDLLEEQDSEEYDWVIPNLIERGERVIVVAAEGVGKTMLARQVAICSAAGIHPFTMSRMPPIRTLTIDLENPERIIKRTSATIMGAAKRYGHTSEVNAHILIKPDGVDLLKAKDKMIIEEAVEMVKPDLLLLGPIYKSFVDPGGRTSEAITIEIARYFDMIRDYYKCALWLEHHAPLGQSSTTRDLRPFGSAVWSRWPEFGLSLTPDPTAVGEYIYDVRHFRGARDQRQFPTKMKRGKVFPFEVLEFMKVV